MPRPRVLSDEERASRKRASQIKWVQKNATKVKEYQRKWAAEHKDRVAAWAKSWRLKDHEAYKERRRLHYQAVLKPLRERLKAGAPDASN